MSRSFVFFRKGGRRGKRGTNISRKQKDSPENNPKAQTHAKYHTQILKHQPKQSKKDS